MSCSRKLNNLFGEGMGDKSVRLLPGIGTKNAKILAKKGYPMARQVYGRYLVLNNPTEFEKWLVEMIGSSSALTRKHVGDCSKALEEFKTHLS